VEKAIELDWVFEGKCSVGTSRQSHSAIVGLCARVVLLNALSVSCAIDDEKPTSRYQPGQLPRSSDSVGQIENLFLIVRGSVIDHVMRTSFLTNCRPSSLPAVLMILIPAARANCTAAIPTPPLAPWTSSVLPGLAWAN
jgi:hypothetical protein